jgi:hypothetical protein
MVTAESTPTILTRKLDPDEDLLCWGRPPHGLVLRQADFLLIPFSLLWGGLALVGEWWAIASGDNWGIGVFFIPFVAIGLYLIIGRFIHDAWRRTRTYYGVSNHRILILEPSSIKSIRLGQLSEIRLSKSSDGTGSLIFGPETSPLEASQSWAAWSGRPLTPTFERIAHVSNIHALIRRAQSKVKRTD